MMTAPTLFQTKNYLQREILTTSMNNTNQKIIKTIELFAGVGGFRLGLEKASNKEKSFNISWSNQWEPSK